MTDATGGGASRWKTFGERVIYDNPWVWLGQVDVELPDGERFWHHVVRLHRAAMMVLVDEQDRVLLLWRHRFVQDRWGWELPGGLIDEGEEPAETAARELEEETGYRAGRVEHLITFQPMVGMVDSEHVVFTGRDPDKVGEPTETTEVERMEWVPGLPRPRVEVPPFPSGVDGRDAKPRPGRVRAAFVSGMPGLRPDPEAGLTLWPPGKTTRHRLAARTLTVP